MRLKKIGCDFDAVPAPLPIWHATVTREQWTGAARTLFGATSNHWLDAAKTAFGVDGRLVSLWGSDRRAIDGTFAVSVAYAVREGLLWLTLPIDPAQHAYPDLSALCPAASRMQRATHDLLGLVAEDAADARPWLRHAAWPAGYFPLRAEA